MPFTSSSGRMGVTLMPLARLAAGDRRDLLLAGVLLGGGLDHRAQELRIRLVHVGRIAPLAAVPGMDARLVDAAMIAARGLDRVDDAFHPQRLDARGVEVQVLRA